MNSSLVPLAPADVAARLLTLNDVARRDFLQQRNAISLEVLEALKAQADAELLRDARRALLIADCAAEVAAIWQQPIGLALAAWMQGNALLYLGQYHDCLARYQQAREIYQQQGLTTEVGRLRVNEIAALRQVGLYAEAIEAVAEARTLLASNGPTRYSATLEMNAGILHDQHGDYGEALAAYECGRATFAAVGDQTQAARMDVNRAITLERLDRFVEAEDLLQTARATLLAQACVQEVARVDLNLGVLAYRQGRYQRALKQLEQARAGFATLGNALEVSIVDLYRAHTYLALNLWPEAATLAESCQTIFAEHRMSRQVALALMAQGVAQRELGQSTRALHLLDQSRHIFRQRHAVVEVALIDLERATLRRIRGEVAAAQRIARRAEMVLAERGLMTRVAEARLIQAACALDQPQWLEVERLARQVLTLAEPTQLAPLLYRAHHLIGRVGEANGDLDAAATAYRMALETIAMLQHSLGSDELRLAYVTDKLVVFEDAVRVALTLQRVEEAALIAGRAAAQVTARPAESAGTGDLLEQIQALRREWHWRHSQLEKRDTLDDEADPDRAASAELHIRSGLRALEARLIDLTRRWQVRHTLDRESVAEAYTLREVQSALPAGAVLLQYVVTRERVSAIVVQRDTVRAVDHLCSTRHIERLVSTWRFGLESLKLYPPDFMLQHGAELCADAELHLRRLHDLLIAPLNLPDPLTTPEQLWLSVPPALSGVPFAALYDGSCYLLERFQMAHLVGGLLMHDLRPALDTPLIVGYSNEGQVPFATAEARRVTQALAALTPCTLLDNAATEAAFMQHSQTAGVIHLATHAAFRADNPFFSWIQLADARPTVADFYRAQFARQPLITLSACETGRGGPINLSRALMAAGAQTVVASLWKVDDAATADLMESFYRHVLTTGTPAAALQMAQLEVRARLCHPAYWGGFAVMLPAE